MTTTQSVNVPVLIAGPSDAATPLVLDLRAVGVDCWSDRMDRVAADFVSLDWAGALVVIDDTSETQIRHRRSLLEFRGPSMLVLPGPAQPSLVSEFVTAGFDQVVDAACDRGELIARIRRLIGFPVLSPRTFIDLAG